jgi:alcohol dehydrogenase class IV
MALEGLMSPDGDPISDGLLMHATRLLARRLPEAGQADGDDMRRDLQFASLVCGHGTDYTGGGIAIPLGHAISARFHIDNGITNAIVLPQVIRFNAAAASAGLEKAAAAVGRPAAGAGAADRVVATIEATLEALRIPKRLRDVGVDRESLPQLAAIAMEDWFVRGNPRRVNDAGELHEVLEACW